MNPPRLIAILDDEEDFRRALTRLLKAHGYDVETFATGEELVAATARCRFACILLDLHMPGMTGFDVLAALQAQPLSPPIIVVTAQDDLDQVRQAMTLNAFEYQLKPVGAPALLGAIGRACEAGPR
jgi:FixJ family two-component response regulator